MLAEKTTAEKIAFFEKHLEHLNKNAYRLDLNFVYEEREAINKTLTELKSQPLK